MYFLNELRATGYEEESREEEKKAKWQKATSQTFFAPIRIKVGFKTFVRNNFITPTYAMSPKDNKLINEKIKARYNTR